MHTKFQLQYEIVIFLFGHILMSEYFIAVNKI